MTAALQDVEVKKRYYEDLNGQLTEAVKAFEKFLQDKLNSRGPTQGFYGYQQQQTYYPSYDTSGQYYSDHGYAVPPTPVQASYGEFYQHKISEQSHITPGHHPQPTTAGAQTVNSQPPTQDRQYGYYLASGQAPLPSLNQPPVGYYQGQETYSQGYPPATNHQDYNAAAYSTQQNQQPQIQEQATPEQNPPAEEKPLIEF